VPAIPQLEKGKMDILEATDKLWLKIAPVFSWISKSLGVIFSPLMSLGPELGIACIAALTYGVTKGLAKLYRPKNEEKLRKEFSKLERMRREAVHTGGKEVCKGLDEEMDKIYFEQLRSSIMRATAVYSIPVLAMLCWVWSYFSPDRLQIMYGRPYVAKLPFTIGVYDHIGPGFWFFICYIGVGVLFSVIGKVKKKETKTATKKAMVG